MGIFDGSEPFRQLAVPNEGREQDLGLQFLFVAPSWTQVLPTSKFLESPYVTKGFSGEQGQALIGGWKQF